jgi:hypothetical protein
MESGNSERFDTHSLLGPYVEWNSAGHQEHQVGTVIEE